MQVPWTRIIDPYAYQITEKTYPYQRHVPVSAYYIDTPPGFDAEVFSLVEADNCYSMWIER